MPYQCQVRMLKIAARMFGKVLKPSLPIIPINRKCFSQQKQEKTPQNQKLKDYIAQNPDAKLFLRKISLMTKLGFVGALTASYAAFLIPGFSAAIDSDYSPQIQLAAVALIGLHRTKQNDAQKGEEGHEQTTANKRLRYGLYATSAIGAGITSSFLLPDLMASPFSECGCVVLTAFLAWFAKDEAFHRRKDSLLKYEKILGGTSRALFACLNVSGILLYILLSNCALHFTPLVFSVTEVSTIGYYFASIAYEIQKAIKRHEMGRVIIQRSASLFQRASFAFISIYL